MARFAKGVPGYWKGKKQPRSVVLHRANINRGQKRSKLTISNLRKGQLGRKQSDISRQHSREAALKRIASQKNFKNTLIERLLAAELTSRDIYFEQWRTLCKIANVDFYLPEYHIVIQADGCYWHGCPLHNPSWKDRRERDAMQDAILTANGFNVYRFWEHDIEKSPRKCIDLLNLQSSSPKIAS